MKRRSICWWPALLLIGAAAVVLGIIWSQDVQRQDHLVRSAMTLAITGALLIVWVLFFSGFEWKTRAAVVGSVLLTAAMAAALFEVRGVTGDLLPIVEFRWKNKSVQHRESKAAPNWTEELTSAQFHRFMGANRDGRLPGRNLRTNWAVHPPQLLWKQPVGRAWSGFVVDRDLAVTQEQRGEMESVVCYELLTGKRRWIHQDATKYSTTIAGEGPRATPTIANNRAYTFGATGILNCLELESGKKVWSRSLMEQHQSSLPDWGFTSAPLVHEGRVYVATGGKGRALVCYNADTGDFLWGAGDGGPQYSSPIVGNLIGVPQIIIFQKELWGCSLTGEVLWSWPWPGGHPRVSLPVVIGKERLLASSGYGVGAELLGFTKNQDGSISPQSIWKSLSLKSKFGPLFVVGEFIYGLDDGMFTCVELETGKRRWKEGRYGHGQGLLVGDHILLTSEKGDIVLIDPDPDQMIELARMSVFEEKTWNPPALAGEYLLVRNHLEAACFKVQFAPENMQKTPEKVGVRPN